MLIGHLDDRLARQYHALQDLLVFDLKFGVACASFPTILHELFTKDISDQRIDFELDPIISMQNLDWLKKMRRSPRTFAADCSSYCFPCCQQK